MNLIRPTSSWKNKHTHFLDALKDPWYKCLCEINNLITIHTHEFFKSQNIKNIHLPITTNSISSPMGLGSDSKPVKINLHGIDTYLSDSMQFFLEYGCRLFRSGAYYIMPSFRGELADERHLNQFYHVEAEINGTIDDVMKLVEKYLNYLCTQILNNYGNSINKICGDTFHIEYLLSQSQFPQINFEDAIRLLNDSTNFVIHHKEGYRTITSKGEQILLRKFNGVVWIKNFDYLSVPFYQATGDNIFAKNADLLFGIGEVIGAGERHFDGDQTIESLKIHGHDIADYKWYIDMKNEYPLKTSGFGMGVERFILWLTKHNDIRDCQLIPRENGFLQTP